MPEDNLFFWEAHLDQGHWADIPANLATWYEYNFSRESRITRQRIVDEIISVMKRTVSPELTPRQREVMSLYFLEQNTQVQVAEILDISQPTVSQHLNGKKRGGKKIGGAMRKIRKTILRKTSSNKKPLEGMKVLMILAALLDGGATRRGATRLFGRIV